METRFFLLGEPDASKALVGEIIDDGEGRRFRSRVRYGALFELALQSVDQPFVSVDVTGGTLAAKDLRTGREFMRLLVAVDEFRFVRSREPRVARRSSGGAHLTGSRVYGTPRVDSDVDLCVLLPPEDARIIGAEADVPHQLEDDQLSFPVRYGKLNLLVCVDEFTFMQWERVRSLLMIQKPVTRDEAKTMFQSFGLTHGSEAERKPE